MMRLLFLMVVAGAVFLGHNTFAANRKPVDDVKCPTNRTYLTCQRAICEKRCDRNCFPPYEYNPCVGKCYCRRGYIELYKNGPCVLPNDCPGFFNITGEFVIKLYDKGANVVGNVYDKTIGALGNLWNKAFH